MFVTVTYIQVKDYITANLYYLIQNYPDCSSSTYAKALKSQVKNCYRLSIAILYLRMHTLKTIAKTFSSTFKIIKFICIKSRVSPIHDQL